MENSGATEHKAITADSVNASGFPTPFKSWVLNKKSFLVVEIFALIAFELAFKYLYAA